MKKISRRDFLAASAVVGAAGVLTACGGSSNSTAASTAGSAAASTAGGKSTDYPTKGISVICPLVCGRRHGLLPARILRGDGQESGCDPDRR